MHRRLISKYGKLALVLLLLIGIFIFVYRDTEVVVEEVVKQVPPRSSSQTTLLTHKPKPDPTKDFCVFDHKCRIPRLDPFSEDAKRIFNPAPFKECTNQPDLISIRYDRTKRRYIVHVNENVALIINKNITDYSCVYFEIRRVNDTFTWQIGPISLNQDWIVPSRIKAIIVECHEYRNKSQILQRDAFTFVQHREDRKDRIDEELSRRHPSVIMLGIDSMSQMNFQRTMPLTSKFVRQEGWYEMLGYNKIGDNSLPNMMPLLTGLTSQQWQTKCDLKEQGCLDSFTFLWQNFQNAGYLTAYAEDTPSADTFHYYVWGFVRRPVNYYIRPFLLIFQNILGTVQHFGCKYCIGRKQSFRYIFDYCLQLVERFVEELPKPLFGLFWTNSFSHDDFSGAASVDGDILGYLRRYESHGLFERAVVILFSDHGQRQGPLMELSSSFLEERLPMLHIYLPPWYRQLYPESAQALDINRHRLSSTLDLHLTLRHFLLQPNKSLNLGTACPKCQSLLQIVPVNRSCLDAGIPEHWCTCQPYRTVPLNNRILYWARLVVFRINIFLAKMNYGKKCYRLTLGKLLRAESKQHLEESAKMEIRPENRIHTYRIKLTTQPNNGLFRATFNVRGNSFELREEFITRLSAYRNESFCVSDNVAIKFCVCLNAEINFNDDIQINDEGSPD